MLTFVRGMFAASAMLMVVQTSSAQAPVKVAPARESAPVARSGEGSVDSILVTCLIKENENAIAVARIAQKKATNKEVQAIAENTVKDHSAFLAKLQKFDSGRSTTTNRDAPRDTVRDKKVEVDDRAAPRGPFATMMQIGEELSKKCLETTLRELEQKEGSDFDRCYVGGQIHAHLKLGDQLEVYQKHVSSELRSVLSEAQEGCQEHLAHAKRTMKELESASIKKSAK